jgi:hypothetical protein
MSPCPTDAVLHRFLADSLPAPEATVVERHLEGCGACRRRLDVVAEVTAVGSALVQAAGRKQVPSPGLERAMERLELEVTSRSAADGPVHLNPLLPTLQPTARPGFIGRLGGIEIRRVIGRGGMGVVYEGFDPALDRTVAVKVLSPHLVEDGEAKERFFREARAAAALTDEHVVTIHAIDQIDGMPFLVLQHVAGESMADRLVREGRLPVETVAGIGAQVARGLAAAHVRGLVHRDVKPANVLIEHATGLVRLTDFGLAKLVGGQSITGVGTVAGTPMYMSPEQAAGEAIDGRSDLFSLGVVLYVAAAGRLPFNGDSPHVVLYQIRTHSPTPLAEIDPAIPAWFCSVVERLLEKDPDKRIQTASEAADLLERRADRHGATRASKRPYWVAGAAVAVACLAGVAALATYLSRETNQDTTPLPIAPGPAAEAAAGFAIVGRPDLYKTLGAAVQVATHGDVIEVHGNGPHLEKKVEIRDKKLTIRAATGYRPRIQPEAPGQRAEVQWLNSDTDLTVEGLDILWPVTGPKPPYDASNAPATIGGPRGLITVRGCRIVCGKQAGCVVTGARELAVENCHFVADGGTAVWWRAIAGGKLRITGSVIEADAALFLSFQPADGPNSEPGAVELSNNTLVAKGAIAFVFPAVPKQNVRIDARRNVVSVNNVFGVPTRQVSKTESITTLSQVAIWSERDNVYNRGCNYLVGIKLGPLVLTPAGLDSLDKWHAFWKLKETGSVERDIRFHARLPGLLPAPLRLDIGNTTGPLPSPVGAGELPFK